MRVRSRLLVDWFHWLWAAHAAFVIVGMAIPYWGLVIFCTFGAPTWLGVANLTIWLALSTSPLLGLLAVWKTNLRQLYLSLAIATPVYNLIVMASAASGLTSCEGP